MTALTLNPWALRPIGNLNAYISAVLKLPMVTLEEERECSEKFRATGDQQALDKLILSHLKLVVSLSRDYLGYGFQHEDLIQEGNIGLLKAANKFDSDRGIRFANMAIPWITAQIYEFILNNWRLVKVATTKARRKLFFKLRSIKESILHQKGGGQNFALSNKDIDQVAEQLNVPRSDVAEMDKYFGTYDLAIDLSNSSDSDDDNFASQSPLDYLYDPSDAPEAKLAVAQRDALSLEVLKAIKKLDPRSRRIIEARWVKVKDNGIGKTLNELADEFKVSAERIRQIEVIALKQLKELLKDKHGYF
jgi:RNA polymerase sigma-32 factor